MCLITRFLTRGMNASMVTNLLQVVIAAPIYFGLTTLFKVNPLIVYLKNRRK
ncbi:hypothetical protein [Tetragenococcus halophilus]|uniref:hypothetical protein n=1 Tax=Tetragenococcus halophilus TaxID=51669 RepID=UPI0015E21033|nr:hypothetical protein [Tetragenococcus halophilus]